MSTQSTKRLRVGFVVGEFPVVTQTFIINQIVDLQSAGINVSVFAYWEGARTNISKKFKTYQISRNTHYLTPPKSIAMRIAKAIPLTLRMMWINPRSVASAFNFKKHGRYAMTLRKLYETAPFIITPVDILHCHFGNIANIFLELRARVGLDQPFITSFYGFDVSKLLLENGIGYYDNLKSQCSKFLVMSDDMRTRLIEIGFDPIKIVVLPVSVVAKDYPYSIRQISDGQPVKIISVGRMVEKKGFDDLLNALASLRPTINRGIKCVLVGSGPLEIELKGLTESLGLNNCVEFKGAMESSEVIKLIQESHIMVQASKTARDGDRE